MATAAIVVRHVTLAAVEQRFGTAHTAQPVEQLTDNGSTYIDHRTHSFVRELRLEPMSTPARSTRKQYGESFVKTLKHDFAFVDKPRVPTALSSLDIAFEHYDERHSHRARNTATLASSDALRCYQPNGVSVC